ncbi:MAG: hypothetical protein VZR64_11615, partial [Eubacterium sp.]|nr:hypothetical protein [Eubacterium sp.]
MKFEEVDSGVYSEMLSSDIEQLEDTEVKTSDPQLKTALEVIINTTFRNLKLSDNDLRRIDDPHKRAAFIVQRVADAYTRTKKNTNLQPCFAIVNATTDAIGGHISSTFSTLSGEVAREADAVEKKIDDKTEKTVQDANSTEDTLGKGKDQKKLALKRVKWDALLNRFGGTEV